MKKLCICLASVLVLSMAFTGCNKDENTDPKTSTKETPETQTITKNLRISGIYVSQGSGSVNINKVSCPRLTGSQSIQLLVLANFINDGPEAITEDDVVVVRAYVNNKLVSDEEVELAAMKMDVGQQNGKLISLFTWNVTAAACEGVNAIPLCIEVVRVNKQMLNYKCTGELKITDN